MGSAVRIMHICHSIPEREVGRTNRTVLPLSTLGAVRLLSLDLASYAKGGEGPTHAHPTSEEIFYIIRGQGRIVVDKRTYEVKAGDLVPVRKGAPHQVINTGDDCLEHLSCSVELE